MFDAPLTASDRNVAIDRICACAWRMIMRMCVALCGAVHAVFSHTMRMCVALAHDNAHVRGAVRRCARCLFAYNAHVRGACAWKKHAVFSHKMRKFNFYTS